MRETYETNAGQPNFFLGKLLVWIGVLITLVAIIWGIVDVVNRRGTDQNVMGMFWGILSANILFLLLYVLPLMIVKNPNTLKIWAIVWIVLSALSVISAIVSIVNDNRGLVAGILGSLNAIFVLVGSIMIVANARNYRY